MRPAWRNAALTTIRETTLGKSSSVPPVVFSVLYARDARGRHFESMWALDRRTDWIFLVPGQYEMSHPDAVSKSKV